MNATAQHNRKEYPFARLGMRLGSRSHSLGTRPADAQNGTKKDLWDSAGRARFSDSQRKHSRVGLALFHINQAIARWA